MHKKRIKDKDYFYTSIRDENGKVKTIYLGSDKKNAKLKERELGLSKSSAGINLPKFSIVLIILAVFLTGFFTTTGLDILNITEDSNEEIILGEQIQEKEEKQNKKSEKNETDIEVVELTNESISEKKVKEVDLVK